MRPEPARKAFARGRRLAKGPRDVQQTGGVFPGHRHRWQERKSRGVPAAFSLCFDRLTTCALEPLASAATIHAGRATPVAIAVHAALKAVLPPMPTAQAASHMGQDGEPAFLAV